MLDDIWENDVKAFVPGPLASLLCTSRRRGLPWISRAQLVEVTSFSRAEAEGRDARNKLLDASLVRMLDRDRQRFQLHALLREALRNLAPMEEAFALLEKQEALCLELGNRSGLAYCYWSWGLLAREQRDRNTEREKLAAALELFTELNMPRQRDAVRAELEKTAAADRAT